jgi:hypothetical protein
VSGGEAAWPSFVPLWWYTSAIWRSNRHFFGRELKLDLVLVYRNPNRHIVNIFSLSIPHLMNVYAIDSTCSSALFLSALHLKVHLHFASTSATTFPLLFSR